jgi:Cu+-exporting ATPase
MAAANAAARRGILIRDGIALEKAGQVTAVLFDKTGTLTEGKPSVAKFTIFAPELANQEKAMLELAAALARNSTHPISQAIAKAAASAPVSAPLELADWQEIRGLGVEAKWHGAQPGGVMARLGSLFWLREYGVDLTAAQSFIAEWSASGATIVGLACDAKLSGLFAIRDTLKGGAAAVVAQLQRQGLKSLFGYG